MMVSDRTTRSLVWKRLIPLLIPVLAGSIATSVSAAPESIHLPGDAAYPESITSTADGTLYVSSFASGGVMRLRPGA